MVYEKKTSLVDKVTGTVKYFSGLLPHSQLKFELKIGENNDEIFFFSIQVHQLLEFGPLTPL